MAAETGTILTTDLAPAISVDLVSRFRRNLDSLMEVMDITEPTALAEGAVIRQYSTTVGTIGTQKSEGDVVELTKVEIKEGSPIEVSLVPYRKRVTAQDIQKFGRDTAIRKTDEALIGVARKAIKDSFYASLANGTGAADGGDTLQATLAKAWQAVKDYYQDMDARPIHFISTSDVSDYLATANISMQTAFGFDYVENFLGLGTAVFVPDKSMKGTIYSTAIENLQAAYVPANGSVGQEFGMTADESGFVGISHHAVASNFSIDSLLATGVVFYAEFVDGIFKSTIGGEVSA